MKNNLKPEGNDNCGIIIETTKRPNENEWKDIGKISGIYKIVNKVNGKHYVGSSNDIICRWKGHLNNLEKSKHDNKYLQYSYNKYGRDNFDFIIIEKCLVE